MGLNTVCATCSGIWYEKQPQIGLPGQAKAMPPSFVSLQKKKGYMLF